MSNNNRANGLRQASRLDGAWLSLLAGALLLPTSSLAADAAYDFEGLITSALIEDQDNWAADPAGGSGIPAIGTDSVNDSVLLRPFSTSALSQWIFLTRFNDESFGFSPFFGDETQAVIQFDATEAGISAFALGRDVNGNGILDRSGGELGPQFGLLRDLSTGACQLLLSGADLGTLHLAELGGSGQPGDWYRLQLRMDLTQGTGSVYYRNLTLGDELMMPMPGLQDVDLELERLAPEAGPTAWDGLWVAMLEEGSNNRPSVDNLVPHVPAVVAANLDLYFQAVDGSADFDTKFDAVLEYFDNPADPNGLYWHLQQSRIAERANGDSADLDAALDIAIEAIDVLAVLPEFGELYDLVLEYQGMQDTPDTMTWKLR
jgi:hypothetical protein